MEGTEVKKCYFSGLGMVAHATCKPSYMGGRDQEDCGVRPGLRS
jgi:hypothetical protein